MKDDYIPRLFDGILEFSLKTKGAVVVTGPKWCGKSETTKRQACLGILRRASVRGKELPDVLKKALERQAGGLTLEIEPTA